MCSQISLIPWQVLYYHVQTYYLKGLSILNLFYKYIQPQGISKHLHSYLLWLYEHVFNKETDWNVHCTYSLRFLCRGANCLFLWWGPWAIFPPFFALTSFAVWSGPWTMSPFMARTTSRFPRSAPRSTSGAPKIKEDIVLYLLL